MPGRRRRVLRPLIRHRHRPPCLAPAPRPLRRRPRAVMRLGAWLDRPATGTSDSSHLCSAISPSGAFLPTDPGDGPGARRGASTTASPEWRLRRSQATRAGRPRGRRPGSERPRQRPVDRSACSSRASPRVGRRRPGGVSSDPMQVKKRGERSQRDKRPQAAPSEGGCSFYLRLRRRSSCPPQAESRHAHRPTSTAHTLGDTVEVRAEHRPRRRPDDDLASRPRGSVLLAEPRRRARVLAFRPRFPWPGGQKREAAREVGLGGGDLPLVE
jgi:hypothetical protein